MNVTLTCTCGKKLLLRPEYAGQLVACPSCGITSVVPGGEELPLDGILLPEEDEVRLQAPRSAAPEESIDAIVLPEEEEVLLQAPRSAALEESLDAIVLPDEDEAAPDEPKPELPGLDDVDEIRLQELEVPKSAPPTLTVNDGAGYALDANDGRENLHAATGMWSTVAVIDLEEPATCLAYGSKSVWALAGQRRGVLILNMERNKPTAFFEEHDAAVTSVALSPTEPLALSADEDGEIRFWEVATRKRLKKIRAHQGAVNSVALSPNSQYAVSGGDDGCIHHWQLATGDRLPLENADWNQDITFVTFTRDGSKILAGSEKGRISLWDAATGERLKRYPGLDLPISCVRLSDEGGIVTATTEPIEDGNLSFIVICHWKAGSSKPTKEFNLDVHSVPCCIAPDRNGKRVLIGGGSDEPWLGAFSLENGRCLHDYDRLRGTPICLAVSPRNNRVLAALDNARLQLFSMEAY